MPTKATGIGTTFPGPGKTLQVLANRHAYAYSGIIETQTSDTVYLSFSTDNYLTVGNFQFFYAESPVIDGGHFLYTVKMGGATVAQFTDRRDIRASPTYRPTDIIIPAYTPVLVTAKGITATGDHAITFVGRIYPGD